MELYIVDISFGNLNIYILANVPLGVGTLSSCSRTFLRKEGEIQVLAGLTPYSQTAS